MSLDLKIKPLFKKKDSAKANFCDLKGEGQILIDYNFTIKLTKI